MPLKVCKAAAAAARPTHTHIDANTHTHTRTDIIHRSTGHNTQAAAFLFLFLLLLPYNENKVAAFTHFYSFYSTVNCVAGAPIVGVHLLCGRANTPAMQMSQSRLSLCVCVHVIKSVNSQNDCLQFSQAGETKQRHKEQQQQQTYIRTSDLKATNQVRPPSPPLLPPLPGCAPFPLLLSAFKFMRSKLILMGIFA